MTGKLHHAHPEGPSRFAFTAANLERAKAVLARYPVAGRRSAVMPLLTMAQEQGGGWLSKAAMDYVAELLDMPPVRVYEVATFYSMYNLAPVGRNVIGVCTTTPCWLMGSDAIVKTCEKHLGIACGETTEDGMFTLREVECLGACVNAPMCQIGPEYFEDLTPERMTKLLEAIERNEKIIPGPQSGRKSSEPASNG